MYFNQVPAVPFRQLDPIGFWSINPIHPIVETHQSNPITSNPIRVQSNNTTGHTSPSQVKLTICRQWAVRHRYSAVSLQTPSVCVLVPALIVVRVSLDSASNLMRTCFGLYSLITSIDLASNMIEVFGTKVTCDFATCCPLGGVAVHVQASHLHNFPHAPSSLLP